MISSYEMALIYWQHLKAKSIPEVEEYIKRLSPTSQATDYWKEVWQYLTATKSRKARAN